MDQYSAMYQERKRREMEAEMNRFEQEISSQPVYNNYMQTSMSTIAQPPQSTMQFIPHSIQRQLPRPTASNQQHQPHFDNSNFSIQMSSSSSTGHSNQSNQVGYTVTPMGMPTMTLQTPNPTTTTGQNKKSKSSTADKSGKKQKKMLRMAGGQIWEDNSLTDWNPDDFRIFCGDLGNDVTDDVLTRAFNRFSSFVKAKVVRDKRTNKTKGYGFVSFKDPQDFARAMKEMNGKYVGSRPIKLRKSTWRERNLDIVRKKQKEKAKLGLL